MKVLLLTEHTADERKSLAAVRSLARKGINVAVASDTSIRWCPANREDVKEFSRLVSFPCVLKLRKGAGASGLSFPESPEELLNCYDKLGDTSDSVFSTDRPLIQEYIPGQIHDACLLFNHAGPGHPGGCGLPLAGLPDGARG